MCIAFCRNKPTMAVLSIFVRSFVVVFADLFFLYFFLPVCLICYFITRSTAIRNAVLVVFSLIFYAWGEPVWVSILIVSSLVDYINGRVIEKHPEGWQAKAALAWSLVFNLGVLFGFKYTAFFVENLTIGLAWGYLCLISSCLSVSLSIRSRLFPIPSIAIGARSNPREISADFFCMYQCSHSSLQDLS